MSRPDATAAAALDGDIRPIWFIWLDFLDDPLRGNTSGGDLTFAGSGIPQFDGTYLGVDHRVVSVSPVQQREGGSETVTASLSGLPGLDADVLDAINTRSQWQSRQARIWRLIRNLANVQQGGIQHYYTGYMLDLSVDGSREQQTISVKIESFLASFSAPSGRTYLDAAEFDPGDMSARAAIAIANGISGNAPLSHTGVGFFGDTDTGGGANFGGRLGLRLADRL